MTLVLLFLAGTPLAAAQETVLHVFDNNGTDGFQPNAGLVFDAQGNLYGTTVFGGTGPIGQPGGTVFELTPAAGGGWTESLLYSFNGSAGSTDGIGPYGGLIFDGQGNLYGTTVGGGAIKTALGSNVYNGTVFELSPTTDGSWMEKILYSFGTFGADGHGPAGSLIFDAQGNLYGTTVYGGANYSDANGGYGTVFELTPAAGGTWTEKVLYSFGATSTDGESPSGGLIFDQAGNLYGTAGSGGAFGRGMIFELTPAADGSWTETVLHNFGANSPDGVGPAGGLIFDANGNLYGMTYSGGAYTFYGTVFELTPTAGGTWTENLLHSFDFTDGTSPDAGLIFDAAGNLYGTTSGGGANNGKGATAFELTPATGGGWTENVLHGFGATSTDGASPQSSLILDAAGDLFGTTYLGGDHAVGTVFEIASTSSTPTAALPEFTPPAGTYASTQAVSITDATTDTAIYYTTNGTIPTTSSTLYTGTVTVSATETLEAIAVATGYTNSPVASANYTIQAPTAATPIFSPAVGTYTSAQSVTIADSTVGSTIYYTANGTTPTTASIKYTTPIPVSATETIAAIASASGYINSAVATGTYTINMPPPAQAATPTFSPAAGTYASLQSVTIADSTSGVLIYYTTDGSSPTTSSAQYSGAISVASTETINAIATASGGASSAVASATYTISLPAPTFTLAASPSSATISSGQSATVTLTVMPQNGFARAVNFSCTGLPSGDSCSFSPSTVTPSGAAVTSAMTIALTTGATRLLLWEKMGGGVALALLIWPIRRRRVWSFAALTVLLATAFMVTACGGSPNFQTSSVTVAATGGGVSQSALIALTTKH